VAENRMPRKKLSGELGYPGLNQYAGMVQEQWVSKLKSVDRKVKVFDEMYRLDPTASSMIKTTSMFMRGSEPRVKTAGSSAVDEEAKEFLSSCLHDMTKSWQELMSDIVLFLVYGWFDMEIVYWKRDGSKSKYDDGRIGWRKWAPRHPNTLFRWEFDESGGLQGLIQQGPPNYRTVYIPIEKLLHFTTTGMGKNNPEGVSTLEGAYTSWFYAKNLTIQEAIIIERMSGTPVIELPEGATDDDSSNSDLSRAKKIVRNIKTAEDMGVTEPFGFKFRYETPKGGPALEPGATIMRHRRDLARTLMMDFIMLGGGDQGSWAMHKDKSQLYIRSLNSFLKKVADVINRHGVPKLFALNAFPGMTALPEVYFTPITKIDIGDFSEVIARLFTSGALTYDIDTENEVRREVGLNEIEGPGMSFKSPVPMSGGVALPEKSKKESGGEPEGDDEGEPEGEDKDESEEDIEEGLSEFADSGRLSHGEAIQYADELGRQMVSDYDEIMYDLVEEMTESDNENEWREEIALALGLLSVLMLDRIRNSMFDIWDKATGRSPSIDGLRAILDEMEFQNKYIEDSLVPDIQGKLIEIRVKTGKETASKEAIKMALSGASASFRYRINMYGGSVYKLWANHAHSRAVYDQMKPRADRLDINLYIGKSGMLSGDDILARRVGPNDRNTCDGCAKEIAKGWTRPERLEPIGEQECNGNDRCSFEWKMGNRIYN